MKRFALVLLLFGASSGAQMVTPRMSECDTRMLQGTYVASYQGWMYFPAGGGYPEMTVPGVIMGIRSISETGVVTGDASVYLPFGAGVYETAPGSFVTVNSDCTGTITRFSRPKGSSITPSKEIDRFVFLRETGELVVVKDQLEGGTIPMVLGSWKRMSHTPDRAQW